MFAIELRTSSDWAREMRGTASIAIAVTSRAASLSTSSGASAGLMMLMTVAPSCSSAISSSDGGLTWKTISAPQASAAEPMLAPAAPKASSEKAAAVPAPDWIRTSYPRPINCSTVLGVAATRVSPGRDSAGTPMSNSVSKQRFRRACDARDGQPRGGRPLTYEAKGPRAGVYRRNATETRDV